MTNNKPTCGATISIDGGPIQECVRRPGRHANHRTADGMLFSGEPPWWSLRKKAKW